MKLVLVVLGAALLTSGCSNNASKSDASASSAASATNPGPAVPNSAPDSQTSAVIHTTETTTPEQAMALAGPQNHNMPEADQYLASHPAALAARHQVCHGMAANQPTPALGFYCQEMEDADLMASKAPGVSNTNSL